MDEQKQHIEELVQAAQRGDAEAFGKLYDLLVEQLYRYMYYRVGPQDAEDLTELLFLKLWENIQRYKQGEFSFTSWAFKIAHNLVVDHYRLHKNQSLELTADIVDVKRYNQPENRIHRRLDREALVDSLKDLKSDYRQILVLKYINDLTNEEIGRITGRSQASLRILQFRALRKIRQLLEERGITEVD